MLVGMVAVGLRLQLVLHMRKDSISVEIMVLCIVHRLCGSGGKDLFDAGCFPTN